MPFAVLLAHFNQLAMTQFAVPRTAIRLGFVTHQAPRFRRLENGICVNVDLNGTIARFAHSPEVHYLIVCTPRMFDVDFIVAIRALVIESCHDESFEKRKPPKGFLVLFD